MKLKEKSLAIIRYEFRLSPWKDFCLYSDFFNNSLRKWGRGVRPNGARIHLFRVHLFRVHLITSLILSAGKINKTEQKLKICTIVFYLHTKKTHCICLTKRGNYYLLTRCVHLLLFRGYNTSFGQSHNHPNPHHVLITHHSVLTPIIIKVRPDHKSVQEETKLLRSDTI